MQSASRNLLRSIGDKEFDSAFRNEINILELRALVQDNFAWPKPLFLHFRAERRNEFLTKVVMQNSQSNQNLSIVILENFLSQILRAFGQDHLT